MSFGNFISYGQEHYTHETDLRQALNAPSENPIFFFNECRNTIELNLNKIENYYERLHLLYETLNDDRFLVINSDENGVFYISSNDEMSSNDNLREAFDSFQKESHDFFSTLSKTDISELEKTWRSSIPDTYILSLMMEIAVDRATGNSNDSCYKAEPFCTDNGIYTYQAVTGDNHPSESGPSYSCLHNQPCPSWYYMKIANPGAFTIHIEGMDGSTQRDVDFCCWGPFDDPVTPCPHQPGPNPNGLTNDKVIDCSYDPSYSEDCDIPESAQTGEYYILLLTNYSRQTCIVTFEKTEDSGPGTTDCSIMPPAIEYHNPCYGGVLQLSAHEVNDATYSWTGPNGFTSNEREPVIENVTFDNTGNYECYVTVPGQGSSDPMSIYVEVLPELHADFSPDSTCLGSVIQFTGMETTTPAGHNDAITSRTWDFGDGSPIVSGENPVHTFPGLGSYEVTYTIVAEANDESGESCENTVTKTFNVFETDIVGISDTTCAGQDYHNYGFNIEDLEVGITHDTLFLSSAAGCDSTVMLELFVAPVYDTTFFDTICFGNDYHGYGFNLEAPNAGLNHNTLSLSTDMGCDSTIFLELYVNPTYYIELFDSICFGESYHQHGFDFVNPEVGTHDEAHEHTTTSGCDSVTTMNLFVSDVYDIHINDTICFGEDYNMYNFHIVNPPLGTNSETQPLISTYGCDSTVCLNLHVAPAYSFDVFDSICEGEDYTGYGLFIPQPQVGAHNYTSPLETESGCDSIFMVSFNVIHTYETPDTIYGLSNVLVSTDLIPGKYKYWIDTISGCNDYHWDIDNDKWVISPDGSECTIIVTTPDVATLTVWTGNSCGIVSKSIEIHAGYFGVGENEAVKADVYPNPSDGYVNVKADGIEAVNILNATGAVVKSCKFEKENLVSIDISDMPNSIYVLEIVTRDGRCIRRITKTGY